MIKLVIASALCLVPLVARADFTADMSKAKAWDRTAQRNVAYSFEKGDGVKQDLREGCAWRFIIVTARGADVTSSDVSNLSACLQQQDYNDVRKRSNEIRTTLAPRGPRTHERDIAELREEWCSQKCPGSTEAFFRNIKAASQGGVDAMRYVSSCFRSGCGGPGEGAPVDFFQACVWSSALVVAAPADKVGMQIKAMTCRPNDRIFSFAVAEHLSSLNMARGGR